MRWRFWRKPKSAEPEVDPEVLQAFHSEISRDREAAQTRLNQEVVRTFMGLPEGRSTTECIKCGSEELVREYIPGGFRTIEHLEREAHDSPNYRYHTIRADIRFETLRVHCRECGGDFREKTKDFDVAKLEPSEKALILELE